MSDPEVWACPPSFHRGDGACGAHRAKRLLVRAKRLLVLEVASSLDHQVAGDAVSDPEVWACPPSFAQVTRLLRTSSAQKHKMFMRRAVSGLT